MTSWIVLDQQDFDLTEETVRSGDGHCDGLGWGYGNGLGWGKGYGYGWGDGSGDGGSGG